MRGTFLQLALDSAYCKKSVDMLTGLKAQTRSGWFSKMHLTSVTQPCFYGIVFLSEALCHFVVFRKVYL